MGLLPEAEAVSHKQQGRQWGGTLTRAGEEEWHLAKGGCSGAPPPVGLHTATPSHEDSVQPGQHSRPGDRGQRPQGGTAWAAGTPDGTHAAWGLPAGPPASPPPTAQGIHTRTGDRVSQPAGAEGE